MDFIASEPSERSLADVLFDVLRDGHSVPQVQRASLLLLEWPRVDPAKLSRLAEESAEAEETKDQDADDGDTANGDDAGAGRRRGEGAEKESAEEEEAEKEGEKAQSTGTLASGDAISTAGPEDVPDPEL